MYDPNNDFGKNLKKYRKEAGLSQQQLADRIGTTHALVSSYERGQRTPKMETVMKFALALRIPYDSLMPTQDIQTSDNEVKMSVIDEYKPLETNEDSTLISFDDDSEQKGVMTEKRHIAESYITTGYFDDGYQAMLEFIQNKKAKRKVVINDNESFLLQQFNKLNMDGQIKVINYTSDLIGNAIYKSDSD